ncbi:MAG: trehalose-phosphatase [Acidimicrobiales bacterium]
MTLPAVAAPLRDRAAQAALFLDYDGTLAPIVEDPGAARPLPGVPELLVRLGNRLAVVAVVSGRPVAYLEEVLGRPAGVHLAGLYGMEEVGADGVRRRDAAAQRWSDTVAGAAGALRQQVPSGVVVEPKGLAVTVHWRRAPGEAGRAAEAAAAVAARTGLVAQPGRMSTELRPPVDADKGSVVLNLGAGHAVVGCFGDDVGDLPAFEALRVLGRAGATTVAVAVADAESPPELVAAADLVVESPGAAISLLEAIAAG